MVTTEQTLQDFEAVYELLRHHWGTGAYHNRALGTYCVRGAFMHVSGTYGEINGLVALSRDSIDRRAAMEAEFNKVTGDMTIERWNDETLFALVGTSKRRRHRYVLKTLNEIITLLRARMVAETAATVAKKRTARVTEARPVTRDAHNYELLTTTSQSPASPLRSD